MSYSPTYQKSSKKRRSENNEQCPYTDKCRSTCPGAKRGNESICRGGQNCPSQKAKAPPPNCGQLSKAEDQCILPCPPPFQPQVSTVASCAVPASCSTPIVITAPTDICGHKTDVRIELYIHQLPPPAPCVENSDPTETVSSGSAKNEKVSRTDSTMREGPDRTSKEDDILESVSQNPRDSLNRTALGSMSKMEGESLDSTAKTGPNDGNLPRGEESAVIEEEISGVQKIKQLESTPPKPSERPPVTAGTTGPSATTRPATTTKPVATTGFAATREPSAASGPTENSLAVVRTEPTTSRRSSTSEKENVGTDTEQDDMDIEVLAGGRFINRSTQFI